MTLLLFFYLLVPVYSNQFDANDIIDLPNSIYKVVNSLSDITQTCQEYYQQLEDLTHLEIFKTEMTACIEKEDEKEELLELLNKSISDAKEQISAHGELMKAIGSFSFSFPWYEIKSKSTSAPISLLEWRKLGLWQYFCQENNGRLTKAFDCYLTNHLAGSWGFLPSNDKCWPGSSYYTK